MIHLAKEKGGRMYKSITVKKQKDVTEIVFSRGDKRNSITMDFLTEINEVLDQEEYDDSCKMILFSGENGYFCTGMDFNSFLTGSNEGEENSFKNQSQKMFMGLLRRISLYPKIVVSMVEGEVMAGGVGIAVASDLLFASNHSRFSLSEALWGLLPSMVMPYLIRRVGYQSAFRMTLTTLPVDTQQAKEMRLIDDCFTERREMIVKYFPRLLKLNSATVAELKKYMRNLWIIDETTELRAIEKTTELASSETVRNNIDRFVRERKFAWEQ